MALAPRATRGILDKKLAALSGLRGRCRRARRPAGPALHHVARRDPGTSGASVDIDFDPAMFHKSSRIRMNVWSVSLPTIRRGRSSCRFPDTGHPDRRRSSVGGHAATDSHCRHRRSNESKVTPKATVADRDPHRRIAGGWRSRRWRHPGHHQHPKRSAPFAPDRPKPPTSKRIVNIDTAPQIPELEKPSTPSPRHRPHDPPERRPLKRNSAYDAAAGHQQLTGQQYDTAPEYWRRIAHIISDHIYERLTGEKGYFDSRVVFIDETGPAERQDQGGWRDGSDGANPLP